MVFKTNNFDELYSNSISNSDVNIFDTFYCNNNQNICKINNKQSFYSCDCLKPILINNISKNKRNLLQIEESSTDGYVGYYDSTGILWQEAEDFCIDTLGTNLASMQNLDEKNRAQQSVNYNDAWIGLHDLNTEDTWEWTDGESFIYDAWYPGEPNDHGSGEDCVHMRADGLWNDHKCLTATKQYFICNAQVEIRDEIENTFIGMQSNIGGITWSQAQTYCQDYIGTDLASIHSQLENEAAAESVRLLAA